MMTFEFPVFLFSVKLYIVQVLKAITKELIQQREAAIHLFELAM
jgi:hypothetical protein